MNGYAIMYLQGKEREVRIMDKNKGWIWLDCDGTFVDLYGVENWLDDLLAFNVRPYAIAKPMYNISELIETLTELKLKGYNIGIISWLSKNPNIDYGTRVAKTKKDWLSRYGFDDILDKILITPYGMKKSDSCRKYGKGILVDDEEQNRNAWDLGFTINANKNIILELRKLL